MLKPHTATEMPVWTEKSSTLLSTRQPEQERQRQRDPGSGAGSVIGTVVVGVTSMEKMVMYRSVTLFREQDKDQRRAAEEDQRR